MNLKLLMVVGAVVSGIAICTIAVAAEPHSTMVIAQAAPVTNPKDKDKPKVPAGAGNKDAATARDEAGPTAAEAAFGTAGAAKARRNWK